MRDSNLQNFKPPSHPDSVHRSAENRMTESTRSEQARPLSIEIRIECLDSGQEHGYNFEIPHPPLPPVPSALSIYFDQTDSRGPSCSVSYDPDGPEDFFILRLNLSYRLVSQQFIMRPISTLFDTRFKRMYFFITTSRCISTFYREVETWDA